MTSRLLCIAAGILLSVSLFACSAQQTEATRQQTQQFQSELGEQIAQNEQEASRLRSEGKIEEAEKTEEAIKVQKTVYAMVEQGLASVRVNTDGSIDLIESGKAVSQFLPPPWNIAVMGGLTLLSAFGLGKAKQWKDAGTSIVKSIDRVITSTPDGKRVFKEMPLEVRAEVQGALTPAARKLIDDVSTT